MKKNIKITKQLLIDYLSVLILKLLNDFGNFSPSHLKKKVFNCMEEFDKDFLPELQQGMLNEILTALS
ncbi:MAG: hypothetical protein ACTSWY_06245 [Promethearchaeota archaeon]